METLQSTELKSVKMVEKLIKKYSQEFTTRQLWEKLPEKMSYKKFQEIVNQLKEGNKILIDKRDGIVMWTYNPERVNKLISEGLVVR